MKPVRRITAILLTLALLLTLAVVPAAAAEIIDQGSCGPNTNWEFTDDGVVRIFGSGEISDVYSTSCAAPTHFPNVYDQITAAIVQEGITSIGIQALSNCQNMRYVVIPDTVQLIDQLAFAYDYCLDNVVIPSSVHEMRYGVFALCNSLSYIWFTGDAPVMDDEMLHHTNPITAFYPAGNPTWTAEKRQDYGGSVTWMAYQPEEGFVSFIGSGQLGENINWGLDNNGLLRILGQGNMEDPSNYLFPWKNLRDQVKRIIIEPGVTSISDNAFFECPQLTEVSLPDSLERIGTQAFAKCGQLTEVSLPASLQSLGKNAFAGSGISSVTLDPRNEYLRCIDNVVYSADMSEILSMPGIYSGHYVLPETVTELHENVFALQPALTGVTLHDGLTYIDGVAFWNCTALTEITIPASVLEIGQYAFRDCSALETIRFEGDAPKIASNAFYGLTPDVYHPADRESWEYAAWWNYSGTPNWIPYENSLLPAPVTSGSCGDGASWTLGEDGTLTITGSSAIRDYESPADTPWHPLGRKVNNLVVSDGITAIGSNAFGGLVNLDSVTLPDSLESIGEQAFYCCGQTSITIPAGVARIGDHAFRRCRYLSVIEFLGSAPQMSNDIFENMTATVYYPGGNPTWTDEKRQDYGGAITWEPLGQVAVSGDINGDGSVNSDDAVYLLYHTLFGSDLYPVAGSCDFDGSGSVDSDDAVYLLYHTLFGADLYPLH